jgi:hypothetical protein
LEKKRMLRYEVIDKRSGLEAPRRDYVVTPDGKVAWWDESQGWAEDSQQSRYFVRLLESPVEEAICAHARLANSIHPDRRGNLFECADCGLRTRDRTHWVDPDA